MDKISEVIYPSLIFGKFQNLSLYCLLVNISTGNSQKIYIKNYIYINSELFSINTNLEGLDYLGLESLNLETATCDYVIFFPRLSSSTETQSILSTLSYFIKLIALSSVAK